jgi:hypothetical protein
VARKMRGQAEGLALVVMAMLLVAGIASIVYGLRRMQETGREISQLAALISEKTGEQVYFKIENGTVYARSTLTTRIKQVVVYNSSIGVLEHNETLDLYLPAGEWVPLPLSQEAVDAIANGSMILLALTERGNLVAYDPRGLTEDIVRIVKGSLSPGSGVYYYKNYGYRISWGRPNMSRVGDLLLKAPIDCSRSVSSGGLYTQYTNCNVNLTFYIPENVAPLKITYNMNSSDAVHYGDTVAVDPYGAAYYAPGAVNYMQVYRVLRVVGRGVYTINVTYNITPTSPNPSVYPITLQLVPVMYIYRYTPEGVYTVVALVNSPLSGPYTLPVENRAWLGRVLFESTIQTASLTSPFIKTYTVSIDTRSIGEEDALVFIGYEAVYTAYYPPPGTPYRVYTLIDISGDGVTVVS